MTSATDMIETLNYTNSSSSDYWKYIRIPEPPSLHDLTLVSVIREDGRDVMINFNAWKTYRVLRDSDTPEVEVW